MSATETAFRNRKSEKAIRIWTIVILLFIYLPMVAVFIASFSKLRLTGTRRCSVRSRFETTWGPHS